MCTGVLDCVHFWVREHGSVWTSAMAGWTCDARVELAAVRVDL